MAPLSVVQLTQAIAAFKQIDRSVGDDVLRQMFDVLAVAWGVEDNIVGAEFRRVLDGLRNRLVDETGYKLYLEILRLRSALACSPHSKLDTCRCGF